MSEGGSEGGREGVLTGGTFPMYVLQGHTRHDARKMANTQRGVQ